MHGPWYRYLRNGAGPVSASAVSVAATSASSSPAAEAPASTAASPEAATTTAEAATPSPAAEPAAAPAEHLLLGQLNLQKTALEILVCNRKCCLLTLEFT